MHENNDDMDVYQSILEKFLGQVIKKLKKQMYPRKHRKLLLREVVIVTDRLTRPVIGRYKIIEGGEYDYTHRIIICTSLLDNYLYTRSRKTYYKNMIKDTIGHELMHAFVKERYERFFESSFNDGSPIFLSLLAFLNISSGHRAMESFKHTELYKRVKEFDNFDEFEDFIFFKLMDYRAKFKELGQIRNEGDKRVYANEFIFSSGKVTGLNGLSTITGEDKGVIYKTSLFEIGPYTEIEDIKDLVIKKIEANSFEKKLSVKDKKYSLKVQHMNI